MNMSKRVHTVSKRSFNSMRCLPLSYVPRMPTSCDPDVRQNIRNWHDISFILPDQVDKMLANDVPYYKLRLRKDQYTLVTGMYDNDTKIVADQFLTASVDTSISDCEQLMKQHNSSHLFQVEGDTVRSLITRQSGGNALVFHDIQ